jgi:hypothetical protein
MTTLGLTILIAAGAISFTLALVHPPNRRGSTGKRRQFRDRRTVRLKPEPR